MNEIIEILIGTHPKQKKLHKEVEDLIEILKNQPNQMMLREKLAKELNLDLKEPKDYAHFYKLISPLLNKLIISQQERDNDRKVYYRLSFEAFSGWVEGLKRTVSYWTKK